MTDSLVASQPRHRSQTARHALIAIAVVVLWIIPIGLSDYWLKAILIPFLIFGIAALGLNFVTGYAGQISLGQAAFMAVGAFTAVILYGRYGLPLIVSIVGAGLLGALASTLAGLPSLRIRDLYLLVSTLAAQVVLVWVIQRTPWIDPTGSGNISTPAVHIWGFSVDTALSQYFLVLAVATLLTIFAINLTRGRTGRAWIALRDHETAAASMGIAVGRYKVLAFAVAGFYAGVAGALVVFAWVGAANIHEYELKLSISILGMVIVGGLASIAGSYVGAAFITLLPIAISWLFHLSNRAIGSGVVSADILANAEHALFGVLLLALLIKEPRGLVHIFSKFWEPTPPPTSSTAPPTKSKNQGE